jgi:hypothetical protein
MKKKYANLNDSPMRMRLLIVALATLFFNAATAQQNCDPDQTPPWAVCDAYLSVDISAGPVTITTADVDDGSFDNCTAANDLDLRLEGASLSSTPPATTELTYSPADLGEQLAFLWVIDEAGLWNVCTIIVTVQDCSGNPPVVLACNAFPVVTVPPGGQAQLYPEDVLEGGPYCLPPGAEFMLILDPPGAALPSLTFGQGDLGSYIVQVQLFQDGAPGISCWAELEVIEGDCDDDDIPPTVAAPPHATISIEDYYALGLSNPPTPAELDPLFGEPTAEDNCEVAGIQQGVQMEYMQCGDSTFIRRVIRFFTAYDAAGNASFAAFQFIDLAPEYSMHLVGVVFQDTLADCQFWNEPLLQGWPVRAVGLVSGQTYAAVSDANGQFDIELCPLDTLVELSLNIPFDYGQTCATTYTVSFTPGVNQLVIQDIPVTLNMQCPLLGVDISAPFLRRCFENYYAIGYVNYSDESVENAHIEVALDPDMTFVSASLPETALGNNAYSFEVGDLPPGHFGNFYVYFDLSCDADLGAAHCSEAHIFPDTLCPVSPSWSGANIEVEGYCVQDTVHLVIRNTGSGDMSDPLDYIIVEDVIMYMQGDFELPAAGEEVVLHMPANGATWRLEAEQEPGHPYEGSVAVAVEGCGGINELGLVNLFSLESTNPFISIDCQENIGSFDPNDKAAFPSGYDEPHYIGRGVDIEYKIRFQNTGTDTAFKVVLLDTLSAFLDPTSVRPGAGSHPYSFERIDGNVLRFTFSDIMLPDSNANEPASHGFVQFSVRQQPDLEPGSVIENAAAIYFDFNEPIITNTVFHTIGENFIEVVNQTTDAGAPGPVKVYPNPAYGAATFELPAEAPAGLRFALADSFGRAVRNEQVSGKFYRFERGGLAPGLYFYSFENEGKRWYAGKILLR